MKNAENKVILYRDESGNAEMSVLFSDDDVWITQAQMAELYQSSKQNVSQHIISIFKDGELDRETTVKKFFTVQKEGDREVKRSIDHYNLDVIIAVGYRIQSPVATRFRRWATQRLHEYIQKGFAIDDERLQEGGTRYFKELLQRIRDIRASERNFYQQVTDIYATAVDFDPRSDMTREYLQTSDKFYVADLGIRNESIGYNKRDIDGVLENIVFMELLYRYGNASVMNVNGKEVDFVSFDENGDPAYYQVSVNILDPNTLNRELAPLRAIRDNYRKTVVTLYRYPYSNIDGIRIVNVIDMLIETV